MSKLKWVVKEGGEVFCKMANTKMMHLADGQGGKTLPFSLSSSQRGWGAHELPELQTKKKEQGEGKGGSGQATYAVGERGGGRSARLPLSFQLSALSKHAILNSRCIKRNPLLLSSFNSINASKLHRPRSRSALPHTHTLSSFSRPLSAPCKLCIACLLRPFLSSLFSASPPFSFSGLLFSPQNAGSFLFPSLVSVACINFRKT